jgi:hypothetical protein
MNATPTTPQRPARITGITMFGNVCKIPGTNLYGSERHEPLTPEQFGTFAKSDTKSGKRKTRDGPPPLVRRCDKKPRTGSFFRATASRQLSFGMP